MPDRNGTGQSAETADCPFFLSERQNEVLSLAARGLTMLGIAHLLAITPRTVRKHLALARAALGAVNTTQAVAIAVHYDLIEIF